MDRILLDYSMDGSGPLTRSLAADSTSGFIADDAPHWSIEPYIPLQVGALIEYLVGRGELPDEAEGDFRALCGRVDKILHQRSGSYQSQFASHYECLDPDTDSLDPFARKEPFSPSDPGTESPAEDMPAVPHSEEKPSDKKSSGQESSSAESSSAASSGAASSDLESFEAEQVVALCEQILDRAGYRKLSHADIEQCVGVSSGWGVPLHVDFDLFQQLVVFARGDVIGNRLRRQWRKLYRRESVAVPIYQRMVVLFRLGQDCEAGEELAASALHLRMFKNIPKQDIDMLLPGARVRISGVDRVKIIVPSLGGFLMSARKIAQYAILFAALALHWTAILVALVVGYLVKSVMSYFQTKNRYQLNLTRHLYFQKLDTNAGVAFRMIQQSHRQSSVEMILAYYAIATSDRPISTRRLRRRCERLVREAVDVEIDFQIDPALQQLLEMQVVTSEDDRYRIAGTAG